MVKYFAKVIEKIDMGSSPDGKKKYWNCLQIGVYKQKNDDSEPEKIGEYKRNYTSFYNTFFPFKHKNGNWYALYSPNYTATRIMELPSCEDIGGEEPDGHGFCPVDFYVPNYIYDESNYITSQVNEKDLDEKDDDGNPIDQEKHWDFGFVAGCVWGDDTSWKIQYLDLKDGDKGIIKRSPRFGYIWLPREMSLKNAIEMEDFEEHGDWININSTLRFSQDLEYKNFDLSNIITDVINSYAREVDFVEKNYSQRLQELQNHIANQMNEVKFYNENTNEDDEKVDKYTIEWGRSFIIRFYRKYWQEKNKDFKFPEISGSEGGMMKIEWKLSNTTIVILYTSDHRKKCDLDIQSKYGRRKHVVGNGHLLLKELLFWFS
jgi:hypothetical protein